MNTIRSIIFIFFLLLLWSTEMVAMTPSQQKAVETKLQSKLSHRCTEIQYYPQGGGWFLLTYQKNNETCYAMGDPSGNLVAIDAIDYTLYEGFIRLCLVDKEKKLLHDQWLVDMNDYKADYAVYLKRKAEYENVLNAYNMEVEAARQKATEIYKQEVEKAQQRAQEEHKRQASNYNSGGILGGVLNAIGSAVVQASVTSTISFDAIFAEVLDDKDLSVPPSQPHNPEPQKPVEPDSGKYWKAFTYCQPCPYTEVDFAAIENPNGFAAVAINGLYGVVNARLEEVIPCQYQGIKIDSLGSNLGLFIQEKGLWGVRDFHSGTELLPCRFSNIEPIDSMSNYVKTVANGKVGLYTAKGVLLFPCAYTDIRAVHLPSHDREVFFELVQNHSIGLYDSEGVEIVPIGKYASFMYKSPFFYVEYNGLKGICSDQGEELIACRYAKIKFSSNVFICELPDHSQGLVGFHGDELFPFFQADIVALYPDYILLREEEDKYGAVNYRGEMIVPIKNKREAVSKKVAAYSKKNDLASANAPTLELMETAYNAFLYRYRQTIRQQNTFSFFAQNYVERIINEWQKKGEFEKVADWQKRVNGESRKQKVFVLTKEAQDSYVAKCQKNLPSDEVAIIGNYDADNETYRITTKYREEDILVPVPTEHALEFKTMFTSLKKEPTFYVENDSIALAEYKFYLAEDKVFKFNNTASLTYNIAQVDYNFDDISIDPTAVTMNTRGKQTFSTTNIAIGNSDVDVQIPVTAKKQENTFVVIIANKNYDDAPVVEYAFNDGYIFKEYCVKTLGIPSGNIRFKEDATFNNIREAVNWIRDIANNKIYKNNARFIFYYSGHGVPDEMTRSMYLLPKDGVAMNIATTGYKISDLYDVLAETSSESIVFLDACFSGFSKSGSALASTKGIVKVTDGAPKGNSVVLSASSSNEVAHQYEEKSHGLFTYYLLKKLQESQGDITLGDLFTYIEKQVVRTSLTVIRKSQTPSVAAGIDAQVWKERKL